MDAMTYKYWDTSYRTEQIRVYLTREEEGKGICFTRVSATSVELGWVLIICIDSLAIGRSMVSFLFKPQAPSLQVERSLFPSHGLYSRCCGHYPS